MGIDRIGKGGVPPVAPEAALEKKGAVEKPFALDDTERVGPVKAENVEGAGAASPLARLRAGEIDVNGYVDLKVDEATKGLHGLSRSELDDIRKVLRDQLATDPGLTDLVHAATGQVPAPPED